VTVLLTAGVSRRGRPDRPWPLAARFQPCSTV